MDMPRDKAFVEHHPLEWSTIRQGSCQLNRYYCAELDGPTQNRTDAA